MRGISTDGAATMTGVVVCIKEITPSAIGIHCATHRLNPVASHATDHIPYVKKIQSILQHYLITLIIVQYEWQV